MGIVFYSSFQGFFRKKRDSISLLKMKSLCISFLPSIRFATQAAAQITKQRWLSLSKLELETFLVRSSVFAFDVIDK